MPSRRRRKQQRSEAAPLDFRAFSITPATTDEEARSVEGVIASETPVMEFDFNRLEFVPRVLLAEGIILPSSKQVPLLDSHQRWSVKTQLGSARDIRTEKQQNIARLTFSAAAEDEWTKVREGHATDLSAGFQVLQETYIPAGKTRTIRGREFEGPINVATRWRLREVSLTPIGADEAAKMRGLSAEQITRHFHSDPEEFEMNEQLRALLVSRGMPENLDDDAAQQWMLDNQARLLAPAASDEERSESDPPPTPPTPPTNPAPTARRAGSDGASTAGDITPEQVRQWITEGISGALAQHEQQRAAFRTEVDQLCQLAGMEDFAARCYEMNDAADVRQAIIDERARRAESVPTAPVIRMGAAQIDKHRAAIGTALTLRAFESCGSTNTEAQEAIFPTERRAKDADQFRFASLYDIAVECLRMDGIDVRGHSRDEIAMAALGFGDQVGIRSDPAYHTTGSFAVITQDAFNKSMMLGYQEFPTTWRGPFAQGPSVSDFKTIHRMQLGAVPNLPIWNDNKDPDQASMADEEETYAVECRSLALSFSYKTIVNDDVGVISRGPMKLGDASARTVNAVAWAQLTSNPTMRDGQPLFLETPTGNRKRSNRTSGSGAPSTSTIQTLTNKMMQMRGSNTPEGNESDDILSLMPTYIIAPSALRTTVLQVVRSIADPDADHHGVANINNNLVPVIEPLLDASSATRWYLSASPSRVETVEVTFLQGQETPQTRMILDPKKLSHEHIVLQTFAAKALDHRGLQAHDNSG